MISVEVNDRQIDILTRWPLTVGSVGITVDFTFSDEWDGLTKIALFQGSGETVEAVILSNACVLPHEVLTEPGGDLMIGVYGADGSGNTVIPTIWGDSGYIYEGVLPAGVDSRDPTPSWSEQLQALVLSSKTGSVTLSRDAWEVLSEADSIYDQVVTIAPEGITTDNSLIVLLPNFAHLAWLMGAGTRYLRVDHLTDSIDGDYYFRAVACGGLPENEQLTIPCLIIEPNAHVDDGETFTVPQSFGGADIPDGSITAAKLATHAVTSAKIDDLAVTTSKIAAGSVTTAKLAAYAVGDEELQSGAVTSDKIRSGAVTAPKLAAPLVHYTWDGTQDEYDALDSYDDNTTYYIYEGLVSIAVTHQPTKVSYTTGEMLDLRGVEVMATYSDGSTENVTNYCTYMPASGARLDTVGTLNILITLRDPTGQATATTSVTVSNVAPGETS